MKSLLALVCLVVLAEARFRDIFADDLFREDPQANSCQFNCNNGLNQCVNGVCQCSKGFTGDYCTCDEKCKDPFGSCNNDAAGTCTCTANWKGRNCGCPVTCPDSNNWGCYEGFTAADRYCYCREDNSRWEQGKKCCPSKCTSAGMTCPKDDGVCRCDKTDTLIPYGSSDDKYKCCNTWCQSPKCECRTDGCYVKSTNQKATKEADCKENPFPGQCTTHDSWEQCSDHHWQGRCACDQATSQCRCKCWYGWAGGKGSYQAPGWDNGVPALYADNCRSACDWTHDYRPAYCTDCETEITSAGAKRCKGSH